MINAKLTVVLFSLLFLFVSFGVAKTSVAYLSPVNFQKTLLMSKDVFLLDIRTPEEFTSGHIIGAKMVDFRQNDFASKIKKMNPNKTTMIYCRSGNRTDGARSLFEKAGFKKLVILKGGINAWNEAHLPLE